MERRAGGDLDAGAASTAPIHIGQGHAHRDNGLHPRANAMFDACDTPGQGMYASPQDPQLFFLQDEDDLDDGDAPVISIDQGRGLMMGGGHGGGHGGGGGHRHHLEHHGYQPAEPQPSVSREFSRGSHGSMGSFPTIPEDFVPVDTEDEFTNEQFAMAEAAIMANGPAGVPQLTDDFGVRYGVESIQPMGGMHSTGTPLPGRGMGGRVASMPNFSVGMGREEALPSPSDVHRPPVYSYSGHDGGRDDIASGGGRGVAASTAGGLRRSMVQKSYSTNDLSSLASKYDVPHAQFLTAPNMRKGKGGRQPKMDPRMDPNIDPKKAKRILANRLSAAKSKLKQKTAMENLKVCIQGLERSKLDLEHEIMQLQSVYEAELAMNDRLWHLKRERF